MATSAQVVALQLQLQIPLTAMVMVPVAAALVLEVTECSNLVKMIIDRKYYTQMSS